MMASPAYLTNTLPNTKAFRHTRVSGSPIEPRSSCPRSMIGVMETMRHSACGDGSGASLGARHSVIISYVWHIQQDPLKALKWDKCGCWESSSRRFGAVHYVGTTASRTWLYTGVNSSSSWISYWKRSYYVGLRCELEFIFEFHDPLLLLLLLLFIMWIRYPKRISNSLFSLFHPFLSCSTWLQPYTYFSYAILYIIFPSILWSMLGSFLNI
jgi:hypothetical protein